MSVRLKINRLDKIDFETAAETAAVTEDVEAFAAETSEIAGLFSAGEYFSGNSVRNPVRQEEQAREDEIQRHPRIRDFSVGFSS